MAKSKRTTPWNKIKAEYLTGVKPADLARKYKIPAKSISNKAVANKWASKKQQIAAKTVENIEAEIQAAIAKSVKDIVENQKLETEELKDRLYNRLLKLLSTNVVKITHKDGKEQEVVVEIDERQIRVAVQNYKDVVELQRKIYQLEKPDNEKSEENQEENSMNSLMSALASSREKWFKHKVEQEKLQKQEEKEKENK